MLFVTEECMYSDIVVVVCSIGGLSDTVELAY